MSETKPEAPETGAETEKPLDPYALRAKIALTGNLAPLNDRERWIYYQAYCQYLGLDPITRPFDLLHTFEKTPDANGKPVEKVILYANASCSTQIADMRQVTYSKPVMEQCPFPGLFTVWVEAKLPNGRATWREGVVDGVYHKGKNLENAIKRATTQAHRRATLALCGIAMPDESEIPDIEGAQISRITPQEVVAGAASDLATVPHSLFERVGYYLRQAGLEDTDGACRFHMEWLAKGAYQTFAQTVRQPVELIVREFGALSPIQPLKISADITPPERQGPHKPEDPKAEEKADAARARQYAPGGLRAPAPALEVTPDPTPEISAPTPAPAPAPTPVSGDEAATKKRHEESRQKHHPPPKAKPKSTGRTIDGFGQKNRNHNEQSAARIDAVCNALFAYGVTTVEILAEVNAVLESLEKPAVQTRYALDDQSVNEICDAFEPWAEKLERDHKKQTKVEETAKA